MQVAEEAAAAWALWEAAGGKMGSQDKDSDFDAGSAPPPMLVGKAYAAGQLPGPLRVGWCCCLCCMHFVVAAERQTSGVPGAARNCLLQFPQLDKHLPHSRPTLSNAAAALLPSCLLLQTPAPVTRATHQTATLTWCQREKTASRRGQRGTRLAREPRTAAARRLPGALRRGPSWRWQWQLRCRPCAGELARAG